MIHECLAIKQNGAPPPSPPPSPSPNPKQLCQKQNCFTPSSLTREGCTVEANLPLCANCQVDGSGAAFCGTWPEDIGANKEWCLGKGSWNKVSSPAIFFPFPVFGALLLPPLPQYNLYI